MMGADAQFEAEREALRATNRQLAEANAQLTAERDDARRQRDECAAALEAARAECLSIQKYSEDDGRRIAADYILEAMDGAAAPATNDDARAILHILASQPAHPSVAVVVDRQGEELTLRADGQCMYVTTDEAAALVTALLADGAVHERWLHGRGGR